MSSSIAVLPGLYAHPSGALWIPEIKTAIIADVHLGYSWAQRRRGELGPLADSRTREKVLALAAELAPASIVFLGDLVHAPRPCILEREWIEGVLGELAGRSELVAVRGNHDRAFAKEFSHLAIKTVESWSTSTLLAVHGDRLAEIALPEHATLIAGHLHPCLSVRGASGANQSLPVFLVTPNCLVLPAFSPFARGYNIGGGFSAELLACFGEAEVHAYAATATRVAPLGPLRQAIERMLAGTPSMPGHFRRRPQRTR